MEVGEIPTLPRNSDSASSAGKPGQLDFSLKKFWFILPREGENRDASSLQEFFISQKMKKGTFLLLFSIVLLGGGVAVLASLGDRTKTDVLPIQESQEQENPEPVEWIEATLTVGERVYTVSLPKGSSAYDLMVKVQGTSDFQFKGREFPGLGFFVQELNGVVENPRQGTFWIYYINGEKAKVGISAYAVKTDDIISWKYEHEE